MIKIIKKKINMSDELKAKINWSCKFNNRPYQIIEGHLRIVEHDINGILLDLKDIYKTCSSVQMTYEEIGTDTKRFNEETLIPAYQIIRDIIERNKDIFMEIS